MSIDDLSLRDPVEFFQKACGEEQPVRWLIQEIGAGVWRADLKMDGEWDNKIDWDDHKALMLGEATKMEIMLSICGWEVWTNDTLEETMDMSIVFRKRE